MGVGQIWAESETCRGRPAVTGGRGGGSQRNLGCTWNPPLAHGHALSPPGVPERVPHATAILQLLLLFVEDGPQRSKRSTTQHGAARRSTERRIRLGSRLQALLLLLCILRASDMTTLDENVPTSMSSFNARLYSQSCSASGCC